MDDNIILNHPSYFVFYQPKGSNKLRYAGEFSCMTYPPKLVHPTEGNKQEFKKLGQGIIILLETHGLPRTLPSSEQIIKSIRQGGQGVHVFSAKAFRQEFLDIRLEVNEKPFRSSEEEGLGELVG